MDKEKILAIAKRAAWTFIQAFLATFLASAREGQAASDVNWKMIFEVGIVSGLISVAKSFVIGIPEANIDGTLNIDEKNSKVWQFDFKEDPESFAEKKTITLDVNRTKLERVENDE